MAEDQQEPSAASPRSVDTPATGTEGNSDPTAAYLKRAAAKMRRVATAAMTGDGPTLSSRWFHEPDGKRHDVIAEDEGSLIAQQIDRAAAVHISSWDPATALAAADWLDYTADAANALGRHRQMAYALALTWIGDI